MNTRDFIINLNKYIDTQLNSLSDVYPVVNFLKPIAKRVVDNNINKVKSFLNLIEDKDGNIDIEGILNETIKEVTNSKPFIMNTKTLGDINFGNGKVEFNIPFLNKKLVLSTEDLELFKECIMNKRE